MVSIYTHRCIDYDLKTKYADNKWNYFYVIWNNNMAHLLYASNIQGMVNLVK